MSRTGKDYSRLAAEMFAEQRAMGVAEFAARNATVAGIARAADVTLSQAAEIVGSALRAARNNGTRGQLSCY